MAQKQRHSQAMGCDLHLNAHEHYQRRATATVHNGVLGQLIVLLAVTCPQTLPSAWGTS